MQHAACLRGKMEGDKVLGYEIYRRFGVTGFHTYGEQYNAMHLNQTLTGIAFGKADNAVPP